MSTPTYVQRFTVDAAVQPRGSSANYVELFTSLTTVAHGVRSRRNCPHYRTPKKRVYELGSASPRRSGCAFAGSSSIGKYSAQEQIVCPHAVYAQG